MVHHSWAARLPHAELRVATEVKYPRPFPVTCDVGSAETLGASGNTAETAPEDVTPLFITLAPHLAAGFLEKRLFDFGAVTNAPDLSISSKSADKRTPFADDESRVPPWSTSPLFTPL